MTILELSNLFKEIINKNYPLKTRAASVSKDIYEFLVKNDLFYYDSNKKFINKSTDEIDFNEEFFCDNICRHISFLIFNAYVTWHNKKKYSIEFIDTFNNLINHTLYLGNTFNSNIKNSGEIIKQYHKKSNELSKHLLNLAILFGKYSFAYKYYINCVSTNSYNMGNFATQLIYGIKYKENYYSEFDRRNNFIIITEFKKENQDNNYYKYALKEFYKDLSNQSIEFLYRLRSFVSNDSFEEDIKVINAFDYLKMLINDLKDTFYIKSLNNDCKKYGNYEYAFKGYYDLVYDDNIINTIDTIVIPHIKKIRADYQNGNLDIDNFYSSNDIQIETTERIRKDIYFLRDGLKLFELLNKKYNLNIASNKITNIINELEIFYDEYNRMFLRDSIYDAISSSNANKGMLSDELNRLINKKNDEKFIAELSMLGNIDSTEVETYCKHFFDFLGKYNSYPAMTIEELDNETISYNYSVNGFNHTIDEYYNFIKNNTKLVNAIAMSEKIIENSDYMNSNGDYTCYVVAQIKCIERLIKEILVQKYPNAIYLSQKGVFYGPCNFRRGITLSADNLSNGSMVSERDINNIIEQIPIELGGVTYSMAHALCLNNTNNNYRGIFYITGNTSTMQGRTVTRYNQPAFYKSFIKTTRNGYFHIDQINTYEEALKKSRITAYWMSRIIDEILDINPGFMLN